MELVNLKHSTKDIPVPSPKVVKNMMIYTTESFFRNLGWKSFFFLYPENREHGPGNKLHSRGIGCIRIGDQ